MIVAPGATFEAFSPEFASGLVGTIGVRIRDGAGADFLARTTAAIAADVTVGATSVYRRSFTAPTTAGQYWLVWDNGTTVTEPQELVVAYTAAATQQPSGRDLCTLADVLSYVPGYRQNDATDAKLQQLVTSESLLIQLNREIVAIDAQPAVRVFEIGEWEQLQREVFIGDLAVTTGLAVEVHGGDGALVQTVAAGAIIPLPRDGGREPWEPYTSLKFPPLYLDAPSIVRGYTLQVTGTFGFPSIPAFVREACAKRVLLRYITDVATKGTSLAEAIDDVNPAALFASSRDALNAIRVPVIG